MIDTRRVNTQVERAHEALRERRRQKNLPRAVERLLPSAREKAQGRPGIYRMTFRVPRRLDDYVVLNPDGSSIVVRFSANKAIVTSISANCEQISNEYIKLF